jgi:hypothetical protein
LHDVSLILTLPAGALLFSVACLALLAANTELTRLAALANLNKVKAAFN